MNKMSYIRSLKALLFIVMVNSCHFSI